MPSTSIDDQRFLQLKNFFLEDFKDLIVSMKQFGLTLLKQTKINF